MLQIGVCQELWVHGEEALFGRGVMKGTGMREHGGCTSRTHNYGSFRQTG